MPLSAFYISFLLIPISCHSPFPFSLTTSSARIRLLYSCVIVLMPKRNKVWTVEPYCKTTGLLLACELHWRRTAFQGRDRATLLDQYLNNVVVPPLSKMTTLASSKISSSNVASNQQDI